MLSSLLDLFLPRWCMVCGRTLTTSEHILCATCYLKMPRRWIPSFTENNIIDLFEDILRLERAATYMPYRPGNQFSKLITANKYDGKPDVGETLGKWAAVELTPKGLFEGIDMLIPVPLSKQRQKARGYNQSETICKGIRKVCDIPISVNNLLRIRDTDSQVGKNVTERKENIAGAFAVVNPDALCDKHIMLVDDVLTTGATLLECAKTIHKAQPSAHISVFTIGYARTRFLSLIDPIDSDEADETDDDALGITLDML